MLSERIFVTIILLGLSDDEPCVSLCLLGAKLMYFSHSCNIISVNPQNGV